MDYLSGQVSTHIKDLTVIRSLMLLYSHCIDISKWDSHNVLKKTCSLNACLASLCVVTLQ